MNVTTVKLPTHFEELESLDNDSRFQKVRIYIAHTGKNLNNSIFSKDVLEKMIPSLAHIPILGYVGVNEDGESDFRGHEKKLKIDDDGFKVRFDTHAYGFVPEDNNAHFEITGGKEWLVADAYLWTRFVDVMELFNESSGSKGQSMEIANADGYTDDRGCMVFTNATFTGLCILGDDVPPAMTGATVSTIFSKEDFKSTFKQMLAEFTAEKGESALATKKKAKDEAVEEIKEEKPQVEEKPSEKTPTTKSDAKEESKDSEKAQPATTDNGSASSKSDSASDHSESSEEHEENQEMSADKDDKNLDKNESASNKEDDKDDKKEKSFKKDDEDDSEDSGSDEEDDDKDDKKKAVFELTLNEREMAFLEAVRNKYNASYDWIWLDCAYEDYGIVQVSANETVGAQYFRIDYSVNADDSIKLGDKTEVFPMFVTQAEKDKVESDRAKLVDLEAQIKELTDYKNGIEMSAKEKLLEDNKENLTADQVKEIKAQFAEKTPEGIEKEIAYAMFSTHKQEFASNHKARGGVRATNFNYKEDYGYGSANELFHK